MTLIDYDQLGLSDDGSSNIEVMRTVNNLQTYATVQPVVHVHPETGERCFLLGKHARHIIGVTAAESAAIIRIFQDRITAPENTARWRWQPGDLVMWDNRSTQHYAVDDWGSQPRILHRLSIAGEPPRDDTVSIFTAPTRTFSCTSRSTNGASPWRSKSMAFPTRS